MIPGVFSLNSEPTDCSRLRWIASVTFCLLLALAWAVTCSSSEAQEPGVYRASYTETPPMIDGMLTSESEWSAAEAGGGNWRIFQSTSPDLTNNRFAILWDDTGLYYQHQVDYAGWANSGIGDWDPLYESLHLYFDPDTDGESNENTQIFGSSIDGYHLGINQPRTNPEAMDEEPPVGGVYTEAYVNAIFGENAGPFSNFAGIEFAQTNSVEENFGYLELFIPWSQFDATNPQGQRLYPENGLYHPEPPSEGETWYFNAARSQSNGTLSTWASPLEALFSFSERPHGILEFVRGEVSPCDIDGDGNCNDIDIDAIATAVLDGSADLKYDMDGDGVVADADRIFYVESTLGTWVGDANLDGEFASSDFVAVFIFGGYEDGVPGNAGWASGDWNGDLDFTSSDFVAAFISGGFELGPRAAVAAVPEPAGFTLGWLAAIALVGMRSRK